LKFNRWLKLTEGKFTQLALRVAAVDGVQVAVAVGAGVKVSLAVPAEVRPARRALHVHTAAALLDPNAALGARAAVQRVFDDPSEHADKVVGTEATQLVADEARM